MELLRLGQLRGDWFVDQTVPVAEAANAYRQLRDHPNELFSIAFDWNADAL